MTSGQVKQIANRHSLVLSRASGEATDRITVEELNLLANDATTAPYLAGYFTPHSEFSVRSYSTASNVMPDIVGAIVRTLKLGHSFVVLYTHTRAFVFGADGIQLDNIDSFVAAINRNKKLVAALNALIESVER